MACHICGKPGVHVHVLKDVYDGRTPHQVRIDDVHARTERNMMGRDTYCIWCKEVTPHGCQGCTKCLDRRTKMRFDVMKPCAGCQAMFGTLSNIQLCEGCQKKYDEKPALTRPACDHGPEAYCDHCKPNDVLAAGNQDSRPFTVAVDFDGVIHGYSKGWHDGTIYDEPKFGCRQAMEDMKAGGCRLIIFTTRAFDREVTQGGSTIRQENQIIEITQYLDVHRIPYDEIYTGRGKPLCHVWLDDRAVRFVNWEQAFSAIRDLSDAEHTS